MELFIVLAIVIFFAMVIFPELRRGSDEDQPASPPAEQPPAAGGSGSAAAPAPSNEQTAAALNEQPAAASEQPPAPQDPPPPAPPPAPQAPPPPRRPEVSLTDLISEKAPQYIGRLGIVFLVIGLAFAVGYSWEFITAPVKVALGLLGALALIAGGEFVVRRPALTWYGHAIIGGGYALASFVAYAAGNVDSVKVMDNPIASAILMLVISLAAMTHALVRGSEWLALLATLLGLVTIGLSPATGFTFIATTLMLMAHQQVVMRKRWMTATLFALVGTYVNFFLFNWNQLDALGKGPVLLISYLGLFWASWTATFLGFYHAMQRNRPETQLINRLVGIDQFPNVLVAAGVVNAVLFLAGAIAALPEDSGWLWLVLVGLGGAHLVSAFFARRLEWKLNYEVQTVAALCLVVLGCALKLTEDVRVVIWFALIPLLHFVGMRMKFKAISYVAGVIAMAALGFYVGAGFQDRHAVFLGVQYNVFVGCFAIVSMAATAFLFHRLGYDDKKESEIVAHFHSLVAVGIALLLTVAETPAEYVPLVLALEGLVPLLVARRVGVFLAGVVLMLSALAMLVTQYESASLLITVSVTAIAFLPRLLHKLGMLLFSRNAQTKPFIALGLVDVMAVCAAIAMLAMTVLRLDGPLSATLVACEMVALTVAGIALRDPIVRGSGHLGALAAFYGLFVQVPWTWGAVIPTVVGLWLMYGIYRSGFANRANGDPEFDAMCTELGVTSVAVANFANPYAIAGTAVITLAFFYLLSWQVLAIALAVEGLALMVCGFLVKERPFFLAGLAVFAVLVGKLVFYDLHDASTIWRILSFVVAGVMMMAAAFIFARFNKYMQENRQRPEV